ncbi:MAG: hypothetical protein HYR96_07485 [Deltaproteobacteria bacterium]|nr:hypothetical protein [Deltaproteobacteria bacterium]MBI3296299.1 hypothetical protein [Deltaproteobacteria bacterium]
MRCFVARVLVLALLVIGGAARGEERGTGIGVIIGEPTGLTAKVWKGGGRSVDMGLAYSLGYYLLFYSDYLVHFWEEPSNVGQLSPYIGIGAVVLAASGGPIGHHYFWGNGAAVGAGLRIPVGISWVPRDVPLGVFAEIVPGVGILPSSFAFFQGGIGIRYLFS